MSTITRPIIRALIKNWTKPGYFSALIFICLGLTACWSNNSETAIKTEAMVATAAAETVIRVGDLISLIIPTGAFSKDQPISIKKTQEKDTAEDFKTSVGVYPNVAVRSPYEIRINAGKMAPSRAIVAEAVVPIELAKEVSFAVFVQFFYDGENETLDQFETIESTYDSKSKIIKFKLDPNAFTNLRNSDGSFETIIVIAGMRVRKAGGK